MKRVTNLSEVKPLDPEKKDAVMEKELGELVCELSSTATTEEEGDESRNALANMLLDIDISGANEVMKVSSLKKDPEWFATLARNLQQEQREKICCGRAYIG